MNTITVTGYPFVSNVDQNARPEKTFNLDSLPTSAFHGGQYRDRGFQFDLRPFLKVYVVKQYGSWHEYLAPNKTILRKFISCRIDKIVEVK